MSNYVEAAEWWRVPAPQLHVNKYHSIILDRGEMHKAVPDSKNQYLFSETGAGVKPLAIVGTALQIAELLERSSSRSIVSDIKSLQTLYMGVSLYVPKDRFEGVFPLNAVAKGLADFAIGVWGNAVREASQAEQIALFMAKLMKASPKEKQQGNNLFVKFSYLQEEGMFKVGTSRVSCKEIQQQLLAHLPFEK